MPLTASNASQPGAPRPVRVCLSSFREARAHWREATEQAHFAAQGSGCPRVEVKVQGNANGYALRIISAARSCRAISLTAGL